MRQEPADALHHTFLLGPRLAAEIVDFGQIVFGLPRKALDRIAATDASAHAGQRVGPVIPIAAPFRKEKACRIAIDEIGVGRNMQITRPPTLVHAAEARVYHPDPYAAAAQPQRIEPFVYHHSRRLGIYTAPDKRIFLNGIAELGASDKIAHNSQNDNQAQQHTCQNTQYVKYFRQHFFHFPAVWRLPCNSCGRAARATRPQPQK